MGELAILDILELHEITVFRVLGVGGRGRNNRLLPPPPFPEEKEEEVPGKRCMAALLAKREGGKEKRTHSFLFCLLCRSVTFPPPPLPFLEREGDGFPAPVSHVRTVPKPIPRWQKRPEYAYTHCLALTLCAQTFRVERYLFSFPMSLI